MQPGVPKQLPHVFQTTQNSTRGKASLRVICSVSAQVGARPTPEVAGEVFFPKEVGSGAILYRGDYNWRDQMKGEPKAIEQGHKLASTRVGTFLKADFFSFPLDSGNVHIKHRI